VDPSTKWLLGAKCTANLAINKNYKNIKNKM
jgi:hypothetical protein